MGLLTTDQVDFLVYRGTEHTIVHQVVDEDDAAFDLANHTVFLMATRNTSAPNKTVIEKEGVIQAPSTDGIVIFSFAPEDTSHLMARAYDMYVIIIPDGEGGPWVAFEGKLGISPVTYPTEGE